MQTHHMNLEQCCTLLENESFFHERGMLWEMSQGMVFLWCLLCEDCLFCVVDAWFTSFVQKGENKTRKHRNGRMKKRILIKIEEFSCFVAFLSEIYQFCWISRQVRQTRSIFGIEVFGCFATIPFTPQELLHFVILQNSPEKIKKGYMIRIFIKHLRVCKLFLCYLYGIYIERVKVFKPDNEEDWFVSSFFLSS